ncbi:MAG: hypothetical protein ACR2HX_15075 [Pyrinomonadaceae bacterium]
MKLRLSLILLVAFAAAFALGIATQVAAQDSRSNTNSAQAEEDLRAQLLDIQVKESELQARAQQLDEDLKPGNIERSLAGIGSTRPEEMREMRRRQLTIERERVQAQLSLLATSRERLESVIRVAKTQAYQESAAGTGAPLQMLKSQFATGPRAVAAALVGFTAIVGIVFVIAALIRRLRTV